MWELARAVRYFQPKMCVARHCRARGERRARGMGCASGKPIVNDAGVVRGDERGASTATAAVTAAAMSTGEGERGTSMACVMRDDASNALANDAAYAAAVVSRANAASKRVCERWGVEPGRATYRFWLREDTVVSALTEDLHGADVRVDGGDASLMMCTHEELEAPYGMYVGDVGSAIVAPVVYAVDVYLAVDGVSFTNGHVCAGEPDFSKLQAIQSALSVCANENERVLLERALKDGPKDGSTPWCTVVGDRFGVGAHLCHLPLMSDHLDGAILDPYSKMYAHSLMWKWTDVCKKIGAGTHTVTIRCAPRGVLGVASNDSCVCRATGDKPEEDFMRDAGFRSFIQSLGSNLSTSSSAEGMTSTFSLTIKEEHCVGVKPERRAQEWADDWPEDEIAECFTIAMSLANTGPPGAMARSMVPGTPLCAHIILPTTDGTSGIAAIEDKAGNLQFHEFHAWGLYQSAGADPDARTAAQIKFRCVKYENDEGAPTQWVAEAYGARPCNGLMMKNKYVSEAIARDSARIPSSS